MYWLFSALVGCSNGRIIMVFGFWNYIFRLYESPRDSCLERRTSRASTSFKTTARMIRNDNRGKVIIIIKGDD